MVEGEQGEEEGEEEQGRRGGGGGPAELLVNAELLPHILHRHAGRPVGPGVELKTRQGENTTIFPTTTPPHHQSRPEVELC